MASTEFNSFGSKDRMNENIDTKPKVFTQNAQTFQLLEYKNYKNSSVISQNGESQNGCFKQTKHTRFSKIRIFLTP